MKSDAKHHMLVACLVRDAVTFPLLYFLCGHIFSAWYIFSKNGGKKYPFSKVFGCVDGALEGCPSYG